MGYGSWSDDDYSRRQNVRRSTGRSAFGYTDDEMRNVDRDEWRVHSSMDPKGITRESRDSAAHPESLAVMVMFDVTGSMIRVPRVLQKSLNQLMGLLLQKRYVEHPQVLFGAVGDVTCDRAPLQIGQFESGIEMDNDLGRFLLEAGGGGQVKESYELAVYFASRHTSVDCWEKRKKKGYLFLIGDEMPYPSVKTKEVKKIIGDSIGENIPVERIIAEAKKKFHIFMIRPTDTEWGQDPEVRQRWVTLLGKDHVIQLDHPEAISEIIALIIGMTEGKITLKQGIRDLKESKEAGLTAETIKSISESLATVPCNKEKGSGKGRPAAGKKKKGKLGRL